MNGELPCIEKFGKRLILSRKNLDIWIEAQTIKMSNHDDLMKEQLSKRLSKKAFGILSEYLRVS